MADGPLGGERGETRRRPSGRAPIMIPIMLMTTCGRARRTIGRVQFGSAGGKRSLKTQERVGPGAEGRVEGRSDCALVPARSRGLDDRICGLRDAQQPVVLEGAELIPPHDPELAGCAARSPG
jgi:hypothetical protein